MKILIIIPAFNEEKNICRVLDSLDEISELQPDILVVNDSSTDLTGELAEKTGKAVVIHLSSNLGIGGAVQTGFIYAALNNYDYAIQFDGDGQHIATEIRKLISAISHDEADMVIGSRFSEESRGFRSTVSRRMGIKYFQYLNFLVTGEIITDSTSGFRVYNRKAIQFLADNYPDDFPEPEAIILLGRNGFRIREVFVEMQERQGGRSSIRGLRILYYMIKVTFSIFMSRTRAKNI